MVYLSLYEILLWRYFTRAIYCDDSMRYRYDNISQERFFGEILHGSTDISSNYRCNASLPCAIYHWDITKISAKYRKNKVWYSTIIVCITFAQYSVHAYNSRHDVYSFIFNNENSYFLKCRYEGEFHSFVPSVPLVF